MTGHLEQLAELSPVLPHVLVFSLWPKSSTHSYGRKQMSSWNFYEDGCPSNPSPVVSYWHEWPAVLPGLSQPIPHCGYLQLSPEHPSTAPSLKAVSAIQLAPKFPTQPPPLAFLLHIQTEGSREGPTRLVEAVISHAYSVPNHGV